MSVIEYVYRFYDCFFGPFLWQHIILKGNVALHPDVNGNNKDRSLERIVKTPLILKV